MADRFVKIGPKGKKLPASSKAWEAVLDTASGLMWSVKEPKAMPWKKAFERVKTVKAGGYKDWRLPTVEELFLLADRTKTGPAIDVAFFPDCKSDWYWTSTPYAASPGDCAWIVDFDGGDSYWDHQSDDFRVRAVRASQ